MLRLVLTQLARKTLCVILGVTLGLAIPLALERYLPGYAYYAEVTE